jgi:hypothetical protein
MVTTAQSEAMHLYISVLEEVKLRIDCINVALNGQTNLPERGALEFCYLQLRMLCELIALGCLVVHGDISETKNLKKLWAADEIVKRLERLHPDFYPHPVIISFPKPGEVFADKVQSGFLTKSGLVKLVGVSGDVLHRGSLKNLRSPNETLQRGFDGVRYWGQRLATLVQQHRIGLVGGNSHFICILSDAKNKVNVVIAEAPIA